MSTHIHSEEPQKSPFQKEELLTRCGNKMELVKKLVSIVVEDIPRQIEKLDLAQKEGNTEELFKVAHKIKGTSLNMGFPHLKEIAEKLEKTGRASQILTPEMQEMVLEVKKEWNLVQPMLTTL